MRINKYLKILSLILISYSIFRGLTIEVPDMPVIKQTIRNLFFHVNMWVVMFTLFIISFIYSIKLIIKFDANKELDDFYDTIAFASSTTGLLFGFAGLVTGMIWAKFTWGNFWINDSKLNGALIGMFSYIVYFIIRMNISNINQKKIIAAVYNIICFVIVLMFIIVYPRIGGESIHPGSQGTPVVFPKGMDSNLRLIFYPAIIGWTILGLWLTELYVSIILIKNKVS